MNADPRFSSLNFGFTYQSQSCFNEQKYNHLSTGLALIRFYPQLSAFNTDFALSLELLGNAIEEGFVPNHWAS